jgi:acetyl esterase
MPLDPQALALLQELRASSQPALANLTPAEGRIVFARFTRRETPVQPVKRTANFTIPGPAGAINIRVYVPAGVSPLPVILFFHGGGWVVGDIETYDRFCRSLTNATACLVVSVDYRLAPEYRFPAAVEDCYAATRWITDHAVDVGGDATRVVVAGDSAGGNLAAVVCLIARDKGYPTLAYQLLMYPITDLGMDTQSYSANAEGYLLTRSDMIWFKGHYLRQNEDCRSPYASPLLASDHAGLPPALVVTAEYDPLRDEGEAYAHKLRIAGVPTRVRRYDGMIHGFLELEDLIDGAKTAMQEIGREVQQHFAPRKSLGQHSSTLI